MPSKRTATFELEAPATKRQEVKRTVEVLLDGTKTLVSAGDKILSEYGATFSGTYYSHPFTFHIVSYPFDVCCYSDIVVVSNIVQYEPTHPTFLCGTVTSRAPFTPCNIHVLLRKMHRNASAHYPYRLTKPRLYVDGELYDCKMEYNLRGICKILKKHTTMHSIIDAVRIEYTTEKFDIRKINKTGGPDQFDVIDVIEPPNDDVIKGKKAAKDLPQLTHRDVGLTLPSCVSNQTEAILSLIKTDFSKANFTMASLFLLLMKRRWIYLYDGKSLFLRYPQPKATEDEDEDEEDDEDEDYIEDWNATIHREDIASSAFITTTDLYLNGDGVADRREWIVTNIKNRISRALANLVSKGELERVGKGVFKLL